MLKGFNCQFRLYLFYLLRPQQLKLCNGYMTFFSTLTISAL